MKTYQALKGVLTSLIGLIEAGYPHHQVEFQFGGWL